MAPVSMQRKFVLRKTGHRVFTNEAIDGVKITMAISPGELWEKRLSTPNGHEPGICQWLKANLKADDVFFDIGSLFGFFPVLVNTLQPTAKVHIFELSWFAAHYVRMNEQETRKRFPSIAPWKINETMVTDKDTWEETNIDWYCRMHSAYPTIVKMDIDGGEVLAMRGMKDLLAKKKTTWIIEIHPAILKKQKQSFSDILELIPEGYTINYLPLIREDNTTWTGDLNSFDHNEEFYVCIAPEKK